LPSAHGARVAPFAASLEFVAQTIEVPSAPQPLSPRVLSGLSWSIAGRFAALPAGAAANVLIARTLPPSDVGAYFVIVNLVSIVALVSMLGLNQAVVRCVSEAMTRGRPAEAGAVVRSSLRFTAIVSVALGVVFLLIGHAVGRHVFGSASIADATAWIALFIPLTALRLLVPEAFRGFNDIKWATILGDAATNVTLALALAMLVVAGWNANLTQLLVLSVSLSAVLVVLSAIRLRNKITPLGVDLSDARSLLRIALPLLATNLSWNLMVQIDTILLGVFRPGGEVAYYVAGSRLAALLLVPVLIGTSFLAPLITELWTGRRLPDLERMLRAASGATCIASGAGLLVLALLGPWALSLLFGDYYRRGGTVLLILAASSFLTSMGGYPGLALMMAGEQVAAMLITMFVAVVTIAGTAVAADTLGALGVAIAMACGIALQNVLNVAVARMRLGIWVYPDLSLRGLAQPVSAVLAAARSRNR
jgi:O-antigen/teichoic acid export membrane protein